MPCDFAPPRKSRPSKAHQKIAQQVADYFGSQTRAAEQLGWSLPYVNAWIHGRAFIPLDRAEHVEKVTRGYFNVLDLRPDLKRLKKYFIAS